MALLFARTDTGWFHDFIRPADGVLFLRKRVRFVGRDGKPKPGKDGKVGSPGSGSMLVAWGPECRSALYQAAVGGAGTFGVMR
ncbi:hypothetical protein D3C72_1737350 [compost metagenome]